MVNCLVNYISSASSGAASRNSAPVIAAEDESIAVVVMVKGGGVLFRSTKVRIIGVRYNQFNHGIYLFGEESRYWGCCHYCKDPDKFSGGFCKKCLDKGWWITVYNGPWESDG